MTFVTYRLTRPFDMERVPRSGVVTPLDSLLCRVEGGRSRWDFCPDGSNEGSGLGTGEQPSPEPPGNRRSDQSRGGNRATVALGVCALQRLGLGISRGFKFR